jgi:hypothetical protein
MLRRRRTWYLVEVFEHRDSPRFHAVAPSKRQAKNAARKATTALWGRRSQVKIRRVLPFSDARYTVEVLEGIPARWRHTGNLVKA